jgi:TatA/E family protein of Tat protein translocase
LFGIGGWEFLLIAALALMLFGPDKLPEFARTLGRLIRDFKRYQDLMESTIRAEMYSTEPKDKPDAFKKGKEFRERVQSGEYEGAEEAEADDSEAEAAVAGDTEDSGASADEAGVGSDAGDVTDHGTAGDEGDDDGDSAEADADDGDSGEAGADDGPKGLPADHPLHDALEAGQDIGVDDDFDLSSVDQADLGWVPGRDVPGEGANKDEA